MRPCEDARACVTASASSGASSPPSAMPTRVPEAHGLTVRDLELLAEERRGVRGRRTPRCGRTTAAGGAGWPRRPPSALSRSRWCRRARRRTPSTARAARGLVATGAARADQPSRPVNERGPRQNRPPYPAFSRPLVVGEPMETGRAGHVRHLGLEQQGPGGLGEDPRTEGPPLGEVRCVRLRDPVELVRHRDPASSAPSPAISPVPLRAVVVELHVEAPVHVGRPAPEVLVTQDAGATRRCPCARRGRAGRNRLTATCPPRVRTGWM